MLTGHSLGGGLAGLIGTLYGKAFFAFDNMPFRDAAQNLWDRCNGYYVTSNSGTRFYVPADASLKQNIYGAGTLTPLNDSTTRDGYSVDGEVLEPTRFPSQFQPTKLDGGDLAGTLNPIQLHSISLLIILLYASQKSSGQDWDQAKGYLVRSLFDSKVAAAFNGVFQFRDKIAYSALEEGGQPYGDTGIAAFFDDGKDFGKALAASSAPGNPAKLYSESIAQLITQFAALLADRKVLQTNARTAKDGILTFDDTAKVLSADLSRSRWRVGGGDAPGEIVGAKSMLDTILASESKLRDAMTSAWNSADSSAIGGLNFFSRTQPGVGRRRGQGGTGTTNRRS